MPASDSPIVRNLGGRPRVQLDSDRVIAIASTGARMVEMAAWFGCHVSTLRERYSAEIAEGRQRGKLGIRRKQVEVAMGGNVQMLVHLGKHMLGQTDKVQTEISGPNGGPVETMVTDGGSQAIMRKLQEIARRARSTDIDAMTERREQVRITKVG